MAIFFLLMLPSGTVTFLFTDLESSTPLWEAFPKAMEGALARHDALLRAVVEAHRGAIVKTTGDGLMAVFSAAVDAAEAVLAAQLALRAEPWGETGRLRVRMAIHSGEAAFRDGDYYGTAVNRAARIMATASGDQVLISGATESLTRDQLPAGASLLHLGKHHLRGLSRPEQLYQLLHPDLPSDFPPLKSLGTIPNNLPSELTSFIGREQALAEVSSLLAPDESGHRLITLTGPGGTGKTRLALQVARQGLDQFPDGAWLAELAPVRDPRLVVQAVAEPMGLREQAARPLELMIADELRPQLALLILDNCEHLIDECARLAETLLLACPKLHILASSREPLGIAGERPFRVRSLAMPPTSDKKPLEELARFEAVRLFVERAQAAKPSFILSQDNAWAVSQICQRLDGIPLAIELAAARARVLSPEQIASRLDDRFRLLTGGSRTALPRQQTLQALIDWSYDLLPEDERTLFGRLSVFSGGWTLGAAEAVAGFPPLEGYEVLDLLEQLVNKSLVIAEATEEGMRYRLLESIRQYAQGKLAEGPEAEMVQRRHLDAYLALNESAFQKLLELRPEAEWAAAIRPEADNVRSAWAWALDHDARAALLLAACLTASWSQILPLLEMHRFQQRALALAEGNPAFEGPEAPEANRRLLGQALTSAGTVAQSARLTPVSLDFVSRGAVLAKEVGDLPTLAWANVVHNLTLALSGGPDVLRKWLDEDYPLAMRHGSRSLQALCLVAYGSFRFYADGIYDEESRSRWETGIAMLTGSDPWRHAQALQIAADLNAGRRNLAEAERQAYEILELYGELGDKYASNPARSLLADLARHRGDLERAASLYQETVRVWRDTGRASAGARTMESLAFVRFAQAQAKSGQARRDGMAYAVTLLAAADAIRQRFGHPHSFLDKEPYARQLAEVREAAGEGSFAAAWRAGQAMNLDQAVRLASDADYPQS